MRNIILPDHVKQHYSLGTAPAREQLDNIHDISMYRALIMTLVMDCQWVGAGLKNYSS